MLCAPCWYSTLPSELGELLQAPSSLLRPPGQLVAAPLAISLAGAMLAGVTTLKWLQLHGPGGRAERLYTGRVAWEEIQAHECNNPSLG